MTKYPGSLHNHTDYSNLTLRDSITKTGDLIDYAIELGHTCVAITDHEAISNSIKAQEYYRKIKEENPNFKLILGNEIYLTRDDLTKETYQSGKDKFYHFILLARDLQGHKQIRELSSRAWLRSWKQGKMRRRPTYYRDLIEIISKDRGHIIASSACLGCYLAECARESRFDELERWAQRMDKLFGHGNFFLEMQPPAEENNEQDLYNHILFEISKKLDIPYIITNDEHYLRAEDREIHKAYLNSQDGEREVDEFYATTYLMSDEEIRGYFSETNIDLEAAFRNIQTIADRCEDYDLQKPLKIPRLPWKEFHPIESPSNYYSRIPRLKDFVESDFEGDNLLALALVEAIEKKEDLQNQEAYDALNECLDMTWISSIVNKTHWSSYYLNLQNIIDCIWEADSLVGAGRGSAVGFLLLYALDIIQINCLRETTKTFPWRFLNPSRVSPLDVDIDVEGAKRSVILSKFSEKYGSDRVAGVATFGTETSKAAIQTAARGLGLDSDEALYLSSLIPSDRGKTRTLKQCYYGDEKEDFKPVVPFVTAMNNNKKLWEVASRVEGLVCRLGSHAGGVIFTDEAFTESTGFMTTPDGLVVTSYELHDDEKTGLIKYDVLSIEALDKMHRCLDLLIKFNKIEKKETLKETYENTIGIYKLERNAPDMWRMIHKHQILSLFQMEKQSGIQGIALSKPTSVDDLATLNSVIRLMAPDKNAESPLTKFARFRNNISEWYKEMDSYGLTKEEQKIVEKHILSSSGIACFQEQFMAIVQEPKCGDFSLEFADRLRKSVAKKKPEEFQELEKQYYQNIEDKYLSKNLCNYVWKCLVGPNRGYGFE